MKILKLAFVFIMFISLTQCKSNDDGDVEFLLTNANFAGTHDLSFLFANIETTIEIGGIPQTIPSTAEGSVFEVVAIFNQNGSFTLEGQFLLTSNIPGSAPVEDIILLDENGTYQLNDTAKTINISGSDDLLNGLFNVTLFTENEIRMTKEETTVDGNITTDSSVEIRFTR